MTSTCPACGCEQGAGLLCAADTARLERDLGDVASIVADLDVSLSRQARIGNASGPGGLARERTPLNVGAMEAADNLGNVLGTWARDVAPELFESPYRLTPNEPLTSSARILLNHIDAIRRHPAVNEMADEIHDAIAQARRVVDRPADRIYLGQCLFEEADVTCYEDIYAMPGAFEARCKVCGVTHEVGERRAWLLKQAEDRLFTVKEAAQMLGEVGHIKVTQASIRGYIHRASNPLEYRPGTKLIRLGDLLAIIVGEKERRAA